VMAVPELDFALYRGKLSTSTATKLRSSSVRLGASKTRAKGKRVHIAIECASEHNGSYSSISTMNVIEQLRS
jgi:hypothetical protein